MLIGVASAPQAAASGFRNPYMIPDWLPLPWGILLAITILATAGGMGSPGHDTEILRHGHGSNEPRNPR